MQNEHFIPGKDASLEHSIAEMQAKLATRGFEIEECSWRSTTSGQCMCATANAT